MEVLIRAYPKVRRRKNYWWNLGEAVSQALAAVFGLNANLTFSAYCGYWKEHKRPFLQHLHKPVDFLFRDKYHCTKAWYSLT